MIAQEQGVLCKKGLIKSVQGTLVLTNLRLIFACGAENIESFDNQVDSKEPTSKKLSEETKNLALDLQSEGGILVYSDIDSLTSIPENPSNLFVQLSSIKSVSGHKGIAGMPKLKVSWLERAETKETEFEQTITGGKKNLADWAEVIQSLKAGMLELRSIPEPPSKDSLEGKVALVMGDMQEKGLFEIQEEVESRFKVDLDPDELERACENLVSKGYLIKEPDSTGDDFYRKAPPFESKK